MIAALITVAAAVAVVPVLRYGLRRLFRTLARRGLRGKQTRWRLRAPRLFEESPELAELRRHHRIDATATMVSRLLGAIAWPIAAVVVLDQLDVDVAFAISGAGFLGVAIAFGGQTVVADFLAGLHILLEDRFGEGDSLRIPFHDTQLTGTVVAVVAFATRLETDDATVHVANRNMDKVVNLSQHGIAATLRVGVPSEATRPGLPDVEAVLQASYTETPGHDPLLDGVVVDRIEDRDGALAIVVRTTRPIDDVQGSAMADAVAEMIEGGRTR